MKKGFVTVTIVEAVLAIAALLIVVNILGTMFGEGAKSVFDQADVGDFDRDIGDRYDLDEKDFEVPGNSMKGLTYAINALAVADTYGKWSNMDRGKSSISDKSTLIAGLATSSVGIGKHEPEDDKCTTGNDKKFEKEFCQTKINPVPFGVKKLKIKTDDSEDTAYLKLVTGVIECWRKFKNEESNNQDCSQIEVNQGFKKSISEKELYKWVNDNMDKIRAEFLKQNNGDEGFTNELVSLTKDIWGTIDNINFMTTISPGNFYIMCADYDWLYPSDVLITNNWADCGTTEKQIGNNRYSYLIEDFELPQDHAELTQTYNVKSWLDSHGDPKYVVYYEAFPEGEDEVWQIGTLATIGKAVATAAVLSIAFDAGTGLAGFTHKLALKSTVYSTVAGGVKTVKDGVVKVLTAPIDILLRGGKSTINAMGKRTINTFEKEATLNTIGINIRGHAKWPTLVTEMGGKMGTEGEEEILSGLLEDVGREMFSTSNKIILEGGEEQLNSLIYKTIEEKSEGFLEKELMEDVSEGTAKIMTTIFNKDLLKAAVDGNNQIKILEGILSGSDDLAKEALVDRLNKASLILSTMDDKAMRGVIEKNSQQVLNHLWDANAGMIRWQGTMTTIHTGAAAELQHKFDKILPEFVDEKWSKMIFGSIGGASKRFFLGDNKIVPKKRYLAAVMFAIWYATEQNKLEKFRSIGENAIGLRTPFTNTIIYGQKDMKEEYRKLPVQFKEREKFFDEYGSGGTVGLLPEVNEYYLQLEKDKLDWWPNQDPQRFYLASPCKADVYLHVDKCECYGSEKPESGLFAYNKEYPNQNLPRLNYKGGELLYKMDGSSPVRECYAKGWLDSVGWGEKRVTDCIRINPIIQTGYNNGLNFCYGGSHVVAESVKLSITVSEVIGTMYVAFGGVATCGVLTAFTGGIGAAACPVVMGAVMSTVGKAGFAAGAEGLRHGVTEKFEKWPLHGSGT